MKTKILIIIFVSFLFCGCALIAEQKSNWDACMANKECSENAKKHFKKGSLIGAKLGEKTDIAGGAAAGGAAVGGVWYLWTVLRNGNKLRKKKKNE